MTMSVQTDKTNNKMTKSPRVRSPRLLFLSLMGPAQFLMYFIVIVPLIIQIYLSFTTWSPRQGIGPFEAQINWGQNYVSVLTDPRYLSALGRTVLFTFSAVSLEFLLGLGIALLIDREFRGSTIAFTLLIIPMMLMPVVVGLTFYMLFQPGGPVNYFLSVLAQQQININWTLEESTLFLAALLTDLWHWTPFMMLIFLVGLRSINPNVVDAAKTLGAGGWRIFRDIKLPLLRNVIIIALIIRGIESTKLFDELIMFAAGRTNYIYENVSIWTFVMNSQQAIIGLASAGALVFLVIVVLFTTFVIAPVLTRR